VTPTESRPGTTIPLDRQRGREDDAECLRIRLGDAPVEYLAGALENLNLGPDGLTLVLRNRFASAEIVTRIGRNREWMRARDVKTAFVANPLAPVVHARQVLPFLFWRDLADVAVNVRLSPTLRRDAEKVLRTRLPELSVGERTALARRPSRGVVEMLRDDSDPGVLRSLAGNPRATESDIVRVAARRDAPAEFLGWLADQSPWGQRRDVVMAVIRHPKAPPAVALRLARRLSPDDLDALCRDDSVPRLVRVAAERSKAAVTRVDGARRVRAG
jgi:hypothetical protein